MTKAKFIKRMRAEFPSYRRAELGTVRSFFQSFGLDDEEAEEKVDAEVHVVDRPGGGILISFVDDTAIQSFALNAAQAGCLRAVIAPKGA